MSKIYFISDTHFCHNKEFVWKERGYKDVYEMNLDLMTKWNTTVDTNSDIYFLGDLMLNDTIKAISTPISTT